MMMQNIASLYRSASFLDRLYIYARLKIFRPEEIEKYVPKEGKIIDLGCGHGILSVFLKTSSPKRDIKGYDSNERKIRIARSTGMCRFLVKRAESVTEKCDAVCIVDLLHHVPYENQERIIKNFSGARRIIIKDMDTTPRAKYLWNYLHDVIVTRSRELFYRPHSEMRRMLEEHGFDVKVKKLSNPLYSHVLYICERRRR